MLITLALLSCNQIISNFYISNETALKSDEGQTISIISIKMFPAEYLNQFEEMVLHAFRYAFYAKNKNVKFTFEKSVDRIERYDESKPSIFFSPDIPNFETPPFLTKYLESGDRTSIKNSSELTKENSEDKNIQGEYEIKNQGKSEGIDKENIKPNNLKGEIYIIYNLKNDPSQLTPLYSLTIGLLLFREKSSISNVTQSKKTMLEKSNPQGLVVEGRVSVSEVEFIDFQLIQRMVNQLMNGIYIN